MHTSTSMDNPQDSFEATPPRRKDAGVSQGQGTFSDIMQAHHSPSPFPEWLIRKLSGTAWMCGDPYLRVVLSSSGTLQQLISSWYQGEVRIDELHDSEIQLAHDWGESTEKQYDRKVQLSVFGRIFCYATSRVILSDAKGIEAVGSHGVATGWLFRYLGILPEFYLTDAGVRSGPSGEQLWREYVIVGGGVEFRVREDFAPNFLGLVDMPVPNTPPQLVRPDRNRDLEDKHLGDIMKGRRCRNLLEACLSEDSHPLQRALLTSSGGVVRILTAYHNKPITVGVLRSTRIDKAYGTYEREVVLYCRSVAMCRARTRIVLADDIQEQVETGAGFSAIFRALGVLPEYNLRDVVLNVKDPPGFGRRYTLEAPSVSCEILEEFSKAAVGGSDRWISGIPHIFDSFTVDFSAQ